jgi:hypothetical protein
MSAILKFVILRPIKLQIATFAQKQNFTKFVAG